MKSFAYLIRQIVTRSSPTESRRNPKILASADYDICEGIS